VVFFNTSTRPGPGGKGRLCAYGLVFACVARDRWRLMTISHRH
jgi:hypothetical protein